MYRAKGQGPCLPKVEGGRAPSVLQLQLGGLQREQLLLVVVEHLLLDLIQQVAQELVRILEKRRRFLKSVNNSPVDSSAQYTSNICEVLD